MHGRSSAEGNSSILSGESLVWFQVALDWPVEVVHLALEVGPSDQRCVLDWALLRAVEEFSPDVPSLDEIASQLGLGDVRFLRETLRQLINDGAIQRTSGSTAGLGLRITETGRRWLFDGRSLGSRERHGVVLHFDALTGEHLPEPSNEHVPSPGHPIVEPQRLPPLTKTLGLDRVRRLCAAQGEVLDEENSRVHSATVQAEFGQYVWTKRMLVATVNRRRQLSIVLEGGTAQQQEWIQRSIASLPGPLAQAINAAADTKTSSAPVSLEAGSARLRDVERLVAPNEVVEAAVELVTSAGKEVLIDGSWLAHSRILASLRNAASRGVRCYIFGDVAGFLDWCERTNGPPGFVHCHPSASDNPSALVVDSRLVLRSEVVTLRTAAGSDVVVQLTSGLGSLAAIGLRKALVDTAKGHFDQADSRALFAQLALTHERTCWDTGAGLLCQASDPIERARALRRWASWGEAVLDQGEGTGDLLDPARQAWWSAFEEIRAGDEQRWGDLLSLAVGLVRPEEILERLSGPPQGHGMSAEPPSLSELVRAILLLIGQWPRFEAVERCPRFIRAVHTAPSTPDCDPYVQVSAADRVLAGMQVTAAQRQQCLSIIWRTLAEPSDLVGLVAWLEARTIIVDTAPPAFGEHVRRLLREFAPQVRAASSQSPRLLDRLRRIWSTFKLPEAELSALTRAEIKETAEAPKRQGRRAPATAGRE